MRPVLVRTSSARLGGSLVGATERKHDIYVDVWASDDVARNDLANLLGPADAGLHSSLHRCDVAADHRPGRYFIAFDTHFDAEGNRVAAEVLAGPVRALLRAHEGD